MTSAAKNRLRLAATLALFAALGLFAWKSGRQVFETGPALAVFEEDGAVVFSWPYAVEAPMAQRFVDAFDAWKGRTDRIVIDLNSPGGAITEGRLVIEEIERMKRTHAVTTRVGAEAVCLSMCVPIYLQGDRRTAAPSAVFMFHEPSTRDLFTDEPIDRPGFEQRMDSARFFERYFVRSEMDAAWREKLKAEWQGRDLWFTAKDLIEQGANVVEALE